jgi:hypothetical protein
MIPMKIAALAAAEVVKIALVVATSRVAAMSATMASKPILTVNSHMVLRRPPSMANPLRVSAQRPSNSISQFLDRPLIFSAVNPNQWNVKKDSDKGALCMNVSD